MKFVCTLLLGLAFAAAAAADASLRGVLEQVAKWRA